MADVEFLDAVQKRHRADVAIVETVSGVDRETDAQWELRHLMARIGARC